jgi:hypothetical protein
MDTPTSPVPPSIDFKALVDLLAVVSDPVASKKRLTDLSTAADQARNLIESAKSAPADLAKARAAHDAALAKAVREHDALLARNLSAFEARCVERESGIAIAERRAADLESKAKRTNDESEKLKADLQTRINHLRQGVGTDPLLATKLFEARATA